MLSVRNEDCKARVSNSAEFKIGDMVWGKVKSHPWWPGYILDESIALPSVFENKVDGFILVAFFGDGSYGWLDSSDLIPYASNFREKSKQSAMKSFVKAVNESVDEFSRRAALGIACRCRNSDNFRIWNVEDYYTVDVAGYEPNGVYDRRQIETARSDFKSKNIIDFLKNLAMNTGEVVDNDMDMCSMKNLARLKSLRTSIFLEKDPTLDEAFEVVGGKQAEEKDGTSAKKDAVKKGAESLKKRDSFLKRSTQLPTTFKGTSSIPLPKASFSSPKQQKPPEDSANTSAKHRIEHTDDQLEAKAKKIKKQTGTPPPCIDLTAALPDLLSLARDQFYGEEQKVHVTIRSLFLKFRNQTFLNIFDKAGFDQYLKPSATSSDEDSKTLSELASKPPVTAAAVADHVLKTKSRPVSKPAITARDQELKTQPRPASKPDAAAADQELKTQSVPASKPSTIALDQGLKIRSEPATTDADQDLKAQSVPSSKRRASAADQDLKAPLKSLSKRPATAADQELKTPLKSLSKRPKTAADQNFRSHSKPASKPSVLSAAAVDQDIKIKSNPAQKPSTTGDDQDLKTKSRPISEPPTTAADQDVKSRPKPSPKPPATAADQDIKSKPKPAPKLSTTATRGDDQDLKTKSKPASKPPATAANQDIKSKPKPSPKPPATAADQDIKSKAKPDPKPSTTATTGDDQDLKTRSKPASKPPTTAVNQDIKSKPKPAPKPSTTGDDQDLKTKSKPTSKPPTTTANKDIKTKPKPAPKPSTSATAGDDKDLKTKSRPASKPPTTAADQDLKTHSKPASKPRTAAADQDLETYSKPASKPAKAATTAADLELDSRSKPASKPAKTATTAADQELDSRSKPASKPAKTATTAADQELDSRSKPASEPAASATTKLDESKSSEKAATAYREEEASDEDQLQIPSSLKRALPDRLIEMSIKKAKLAQQKSLNQKAAAQTPWKQESHTYLILKFPRKSPLPSLSNLKVRFAQFKDMVVEGNRVMWNHHACRVQFRHRSEALEALNYVKSNYVFGQYEIECSLKAVEEPKEAAASAPRPILKKATGGPDSGKESQRVQFVLPREEPPCADLAVARDPEARPAVAGEESREPPVQVGVEDDEVFKRSFLGVLEKVADVVSHLRATPGFSLHRFVQY